MINLKIHPFPALFTLCSLSLTAQESDADKDLIQLSGVVITSTPASGVLRSDSIRPVPFVNIVISNTRRGTTSDYYGYFSIVARKGDTLAFSAIGFKRESYRVPDTLGDSRYVLMQTLTPDTVLLREVTIYPWPTKEQFREAFLNLRVPDDDMARAERNLDREKMQEQYDVTPMDAGMNFTFAMQQESAKLYYAGQLPPNNLLNPMAWMKFIEAWKRGDFRKRD